MNKSTHYHKRVASVIDHHTGTVREVTIVLGGHKRLAQTARGKDTEERLAELFKHQRSQTLSPESARFLRRGGGVVPEEMSPLHEFALLMRVEADPEGTTFDELATEDGWTHHPGRCTCGGSQTISHWPRCGWLWEDDA